MHDLTISQGYLLCSLGDKGTISSLRAEVQVGLVASGVMDLLLEGCGTLQQKKFDVAGPLPGRLEPLSSLYEFLQEKPRILEDIASEYNFSFTDRRYNQLLQDLGRSLVTMGLAEERQGGLWGNKTCYLPDPQGRDQVIQSLRAELLEAGELSDEAAALAVLLAKTGQLGQYFSKYERGAIKARIKELKHTSNNKIVQEMVDYITALVVVIAVC